MWKNSILGFSLIILFAACSSNSSTEAEKVNGSTSQTESWIYLFDGETFDGWQRYGGGEVGKAWKIKDGAMYLDVSNREDWGPEDGGDIVTVDEFEDFHFQIEWKISENGNSGIMFYVQDTGEYGYPWMTGPEMQILDNDGHPDGKIITHRSGDLYDLIACSEETVRPVGEWNLAEIVSKEGKLELYLNNVLVVSTSMWTDEWYEMIANSKFKDMPGFGRYQKGRIALQDHSDEVWFRNIRIRKLY